MGSGTDQRIILVVEDDGLLRANIADALRSSGWGVIEARSGEAAVALIRSGVLIHTLVTDIQLGGGLTGWDVADTAVRRDPGMQVIYASGNPIDETRIVPRSRFIAKPYQLSEIVAACAPPF
jgi:CheY-like chemotaxis protein